jgi:hypothetical protein
VPRIVRMRYTAAFSRRSFLGCAGTAGFALLLPGCGGEGDDDSAAPGDDDSAPPGDDDDSAAVPPRVQIIDGPLQVSPGTRGTWTIQLQVAAGGLVAGDGIALAVEHGSDWCSGRDALGGFDSRFGGLTVDSDGDAAFEVLRETFTSGANAAEILLAEGHLEPGQLVWITVGDSTAGEEVYAPTMAHDAALHVYEHTVDETTEDGFRLYREVLPTPVVTVQPGEAAALSVLASSHAMPGEALSVVLRIEDERGNGVAGFIGAVELFDDGASTLLWSGEVVADDRGAARVEGAVVADEGVVRLRAEVQDMVGYGGPVQVGGAALPVRWGQIHGHSLVSDGLGTAQQWYDYARDASNLDFAALSDHGVLTEQVMDHQFFRHDILEGEWAAYAEATRAAHEPGAFVTFLAYEWTSNLYSDKCVYFLHDDEAWEPYPATLDELYARYTGRAPSVTIVSHMMWATAFMRATDWSTFDPDLERVVEVASVHGVREYAGNPYWTDDDVWAQQYAASMAGNLVADGLAAGHRLGLVCGDDGHQGMPANSHRGRHPCRCAGLMAVRSGDLTRDAIWDAWRGRRTWGTTGPRVLLEFSCNGEDMGAELSQEPGQPRSVRVQVHAPVGVERIEIVRDDPANPVHTETFDVPTWNPPVLEWTDTEPLAGEAFYYARVFMEGQQMAWTSPIWVVAG